MSPTVPLYVLPSLKHSPSPRRQITQSTSTSTPRCFCNFLNNCWSLIGCLTRWVIYLPSLVYVTPRVRSSKIFSSLSIMKLVRCVVWPQGGAARSGTIVIRLCVRRVRKRIDMFHVSLARLFFVLFGVQLSRLLRFYISRRAQILDEVERKRGIRHNRVEEWDCNLGHCYWFV